MVPVSQRMDLSTAEVVIFLGSKGAHQGNERERLRSDSCSTRAGRDVGGYWLLPVCSMIRVQWYEDDKITSQLSGTEGIKTRLNKSIVYCPAFVCLVSPVTPPLKDVVLVPFSDLLSLKLVRTISSTWAQLPDNSPYSSALMTFVTGEKLQTDCVLGPTSITLVREQ